MTPPAPRLLVTARAREPIDRLVPTHLPQVPWAYAEGFRPADWGSVEAMLVGSIDRELPGFDAGMTPRLAFVQRQFTGLDGFPFERFPPSVRVAGNVGAFAPFVAEHAVSLALGAARELVRAHQQVHAGRLRPPPQQRTLWHRSAVILGYGEIGRGIAQRLAGFEMRVLGVNRTGQMGAGCDGMYAADRLADAVGEGDVVFDARPLTRSTRGTITAPILAAMRPDAVYVNVGRAGTVDEDALYRHLVDHPSFRAALDVWWDEDFGSSRVSSRHRFTELPNVIATPHSAGFGSHVEEYVLSRALDNLGRYFRGETPLYVADRTEYVP